jgi:xylitol oxidase
VLAASVAAIDLVTATGDVVTLRRGNDSFEGAVVALGRLGVVTAHTLDIQPTFEVRQQVHLGLPGEAAIEHVLELLSGAYSVSVFTRWEDPPEFQILSKQRTDAGDDAAATAAQRWGARPASGPWHMVPGMPVENVTQQLGVAGPWFERLPHFRLEFTPSSGDEMQTEYFVDRSNARAALEAVASVGPVVEPVLQVGEIRAIAGDDLWLSPAYGRDSVALHFTWVLDMAAVRPALRAVEDALAPLDARPHFGKVFTTPAETVRSLYPKLPEANALAKRFDPGGVFSNRFVEEYLEG